jgi:phage shock protein E
MPSRRLTASLAALLVAGSLAACGSGDPDVSVTAGSVAASAPAEGAELDPAAFAAALKRSDTTILDVRTPQEYAEGHLPGAVNIDVEGPDFAQQVQALDPTAPYAVYCRSGNRSAVAIQVMDQLGFTNAYHLGGGITAWKGDGGEVVTD